jgi:hypothetical protein
MRHVNIRTEAASVRVSRTATSAASLFETSREALFLIWARIGLHPATAFGFLSLAFGSLVAIVLPPLRGPDEISHFLRIYSYARGELLPVAEVDGRKGIFVDRKLYQQLSFFKSAGEWFATAREKDVRYGQVMALYRDAGNIVDDSDQAAIFAPFAGTEGYTPIAYLPYIPAAAVGRLLRLDFPDLLLLMRLFGIAAFTALAAYAIRVSPALKWGFVLIAMLPVSLYNRSVLSADCRWADLGALALDDVLRSQQTAADRVRAARIDDLPSQRPAAALAKRFDRHSAVPCSVAPVGARRVSRGRGLAPPDGQIPSARRIQSAVEAFLHVGASIAFSAGGLDDFHRLGRQAVAGADRHPGLAGYLASILDLPGAHGLSSVRSCTKTAAGRRDACAGGGVKRPYRVGLCFGRLSDLFSHLYTSRRGPCSRRSGTLFHYRSPGRCGICRRHDQPRAAKWHALGHCDRRLIALRNCDR